MFGYKQEGGGAWSCQHDRHHCGMEGGGEGRGRHGMGGPRGRGGRGPGRDGEGRGPGRGRRMFGPGDLRVVLLALIEQEEPRHGYDLIKAIEALFGGGYAPSPGVVYPTLSLLADEGLLTGVEDATGKRVFTLTPEGRAWLNENRTAVDGVMQRMALAARLVSGEQTPEIVKDALHTLRQAVVMKPGDWSEPETARVVESLMKAVREISGQ